MTSWVIEYHYDDGDVGAHPMHEEAQAATVLGGFSTSDRHQPSHVVIHLDTEAGQALSTRMHDAAVKAEKPCEDCDGNRYRMATRGDGTRAIERCDTCSLGLSDDEAVHLFLREVYSDCDAWVEHVDKRERTPAQMLDYLRSMLSWVTDGGTGGYIRDEVAGRGGHDVACASLSCSYDPRPCDCGVGEPSDG